MSIDSDEGSSAAVTPNPSAARVPQEAAPKGPDKEVAEKVATLKEVVLDKKFARDAEGLQVIDALHQKWKAGLDEKDKQAIVKALDGVFTHGKQRPHDTPALFSGAAMALGYCGAERATGHQTAFTYTRFPEK